MPSTEDTSLVLRTSTGMIIFAVVFGIACAAGGVAAGAALAFHGWWIFATIALLTGLLILFALVNSVSRKYVIDDDGVEKTSFGHAPRRLSWVDVKGLEIKGSITLLGTEPGVKLKVPSGYKDFPGFLDFLENRIEYEHWLRSAATPEGDVSEEGGVYRRTRWLVVSLIVAAVLWVLAIGFSLRSDMFAGNALALHGRGALIALIFNFLFVYYPFAGILTLSGLAFAATTHVTRGWHTLHIEQDGLQFDSILGGRWISYEEIYGVEYKIGRAQVQGQVQATMPVVRLVLHNGDDLSLFGGKTGLRVKDAIEAAMTDHVNRIES